MQCPSYKPVCGLRPLLLHILDPPLSVPLSVPHFIFIDNLFNGVFKSICAKHNFYYIYGIYQCIFNLDIFISFSETSMVITWIGLFCNLWGHRSERSGVFPTHLDASVRRVALKSLTPGGEYQLIGKWLPVSEVGRETLVTRVNHLCRSPASRIMFLLRNTHASRLLNRAAVFICGYWNCQN